MPTVLVSGASRGLGLEFARQYAAEGWQVIACARSPRDSAALDALRAAAPAGQVQVHALDVTDVGAIEALARSLQERPIDLLINNAGAMARRGGSSASRSGAFGASDWRDWEELFRVNAFAPMKMAEAFVPHLARGSGKRLVALSTIMASMARNTLGGFYPYRASKAALNAVVVSLAVDLGRRHGIVVAALHPGWVRTDMGGARADIEPAVSVSGMRRVIGALDRERSGRFWSYDGTELPW